MAAMNDPKQLHPAMAVLRARFMDGLAKRMQGMQQLCEDGSEDALKSLQRQAHSLVGAAGLHDFQAVALEAAQLSEALRQGAGLQDAQRLLLLLEHAVRTGESHDVDNPQVATQGQRRIAVVCQSDDERVSLQSLLEADGHAVQTAAAPRDLPPDDRRDLVLLGLQFGDDPAAGLKAIEFARQLGLGRSVLVSTTHRGLDQKLAAYRAGAEAVLVKPYGAEELRRAVACALFASAREARVVVLATADEAVLWPKKWKRVDRLSALVAAIDTHTFDAVVLTGSTPEACLPDLTRLLRDQSPALPVIWCVPKMDDELLAEAALAGAASVIPQNVNVVRLQAVVDSHAVRASALAQKDQQLLESLYELNRQRLALDRHAAVSLANAEGELISTSPHHAELRNCSMESLIGSHLSDHRPGKAEPELPTGALATARSGAVWQGRLSLPRADQRPCWVEATLIPFMNAEGSVYRFLLARTDVTRQVTSELQLAKLRQSEMDTASAIQTTLLVPPLPANPAACWVGACFEAATYVAGDFHELLELTPGCVDVVIGDVMGKGVPAAMVGAAVKLELSRCVHRLTSQHSDRAPSPAEIVTALNQIITPRLILLDTFVTMAYMRLDPGAQRITVVGCGHPQSQVCHAGGLYTLPNDNPPLGILEVEPFLESHHDLPRGASVLLYSDGLSETENVQGEALGERQIEAAFLALASATAWPGEVAQGLLAFTRAHRGSQPVADDQTIVVIRTPDQGEHLLSVCPDLTQMKTLRQSLRTHVGERAPLEVADRMELALCEAFSNTVRHGKAVRGAARIHVSLRLTERELTVDLYDEMQAFELSDTVAELGEDPWAEGGMGLGLIQALCDRVSYTRSQGFNHCQLVAHLPPQPQ